jgi:hypothetical protein
MSASVLLAKTRNNSASSRFVRIQRMIEIFGVMPVPPGDESHLLRHAIDPMAALARTAHHHRVAHALVMQVLRNDAGFVAFDGEIEETRSTR